MELNIDFLKNASSYLDEEKGTHVLAFSNGSKFSIEFLLDMKALISDDKFTKIMKIIDQSELKINILMNYSMISLVFDNSDL
jgi:hypothetical protein